ncbi:MAG: Uncharacterised protein [Pseudidiomarina mangrovi]|nr:MAG: Uncharacterised protein [Pseudidiomarina mangrovi]
MKHRTKLIHQLIANCLALMVIFPTINYLASLIYICFAVVLTRDLIYHNHSTFGTNGIILWLCFIFGSAQSNFTFKDPSDIHINATSAGAVFVLGAYFFIVYIIERRRIDINEKL